jgi:hypothetical protein
MRSLVPMFALILVGCSSTPAMMDGGGSDSAPPQDSGSDGAMTGALPFTPSNINIDKIDLSKLTDEDVSTNCEIRTGEGELQSCFKNVGDATMMQSDGSKVHVIVVKSARIEPTANMRIHGGLPLAIVSLGDFTVLGTIDAHSAMNNPGPGGFTAIGNQKGTGGCGGAGATGTTGTPGAAAGGGSNCGVGGQGGLELNAGGQPGPKTPACGTVEIIPLVGGSSGGGGDIGGGGGGGALQIVSGTTITVAASGVINVGGGGGFNGGLAAGQEAGGGGAGGTLLFESLAVKVAGTLAANGGGGGGGGAGSNNGGDGSADAMTGKGGPGTNIGGAGGAGMSIDGTTPAMSMAGSAAGGGGGAGRIRINTKSGMADLMGSTVSPAIATSCVSQGMVKP